VSGWVTNWRLWTVSIIGLTIVIGIGWWVGYGPNRKAAIESSAGVPVAATRLLQPTFNAVVLDVLIHDSYYGDADANLTAPPVWTVPSGADVILNLENQGTLKHNWAIVKKGATVPVPYQEGQDSNLLLYGVGMVYSGSKTTATFSAPEAGEYTVICTVAGHFPMMQGRLVVQ